jgi:cytochrome c556
MNRTDGEANMFSVIRSGIPALIVAALAVSAMPGPADAQMAGKAIEARKAIMKNNGKNFGVIAGFVKKGKGTAADAARSARQIASNLSRFPNNFPEGTSQGAGAGTTRAKAEIWQNWSRFTGGAASVAKLALDLSLAAETGDKGAIGKAMGAMGKGCGGCHKAWRGPKN